jgi:hypothetical protein
MTDWDLLIQSYMRIGPSKSMNKSLALGSWLFGLLIEVLLRGGDPRE